MAALALLAALLLIALLLLADEGSVYTAARHLLRNLVRALF